MVHSNHSRRRNGDREEIRIARADSESLTQTIIRGLAVIKNVPASKVGPLYDYVEMEALNTQLRHASRSGSTVTVEFTAGEYTVVVSDDQEVYIHDGTPGISR